MKRIARWFWIPALLVPTAAGAGATSTKFTAAMFIHDTSIPITQSGGFRLPSALAARGWTCQVTDEALSDDGRRVFRNIACRYGDSTVVASAACLRTARDFDSGAFSLRAGDVDAALVITCKTSVAGGASL